MSATYINPALPSMIRGLYRADLREKSIQNMLDLAADLVQELIEVRAAALAEQDTKEPDWEYGYTSKWGTVAAASQADAETRAADYVRGITEARESGDLKYHGKVVKRIATPKAGPWMPVEGEAE